MKAFFQKWVMLLRQPWYRLPIALRQALVIGVLAVGAGLVAVAFHASVEWLSERTFKAFVESGTLWFLGGALVSVVLGSALATWIIRTFEPSCAGGGVLPVKLAFWKSQGYMRLRTAIVKFAGSAITLGCGVSMGPEGPAAQIGASVMSSAAGGLGVPKNKRRAFAAAGAAASLAAVFNAPLTAIAFVLEEVIGDLTSRLIGGIVLAAVIGALVAHALIGPQPAFKADALSDASWRGMILCPLVATLAALAGVGFQRGALWVRARCKGWRVIAPRWHPIVGALGTWVLGGAAFVLTGRIGVFGVGYSDVTACIDGSLSWSTAVTLGAAKLGATLLAVGTASCGGIFAPNLFVGAMCGGAIAGLASLAGAAFPLSHSDQAMLVMAGMCACLGAVIRTPVTCILLIFEVTHQLVIIPLLLVATVISQLVSRRLCKEGIYESMMRQDGDNPDTVLPPHDYHRWRELPCENLMRPNPITTSSLEPNALRKLLAASTHERFPVLSASGDITGILSRHEAQLALAENRSPVLTPAVWVPPLAPISHVQSLLIKSPKGMLCIGDEHEQRLYGILTANDLLREQIAIAEDEDNS